jgi:RsmE family RNA methyltransferase
MNLVILFPEDFVGPGLVCLRGRRQAHIREVLRSKAGDTLRVGLLGGRKGVAGVVRLDPEEVELEVELNRDPPRPWASRLVVALPRPPVLKRILQAATAMGIKDIHLVQTARVEKSFWNSPVLAGAQLRECCLLGLEQAGDTVLPVVSLHRLFRPFVEDVLPSLARDMKKIVAHPSGGLDGDGPPRWIDDPAAIMVGPEGGLVNFEIDLLARQGFESWDLGERVLKVETATAVLLGRLRRRAQAGS